ncbi:MAG: prephenate dehydratase domain-containing protein [Pseudomonadota bacterium]
MECIFFDFDTRFEILHIATLGPSGTSSEQSAIAFGEHAIKNGLTSRYQLSLCATYEEASRKVTSSDCHALIVANAYHGINEFYMSNGLNLASAFLHYTPHYGIAVRGDLDVSDIVISTHPAPQALIQELLPAGLQIQKTIFKDSTSMAARAAAEGEVDAALTTEVAAELYKLRFISKTRPIQMLWSVFTAPLNAESRHDRHSSLSSVP